MSTLLSLMANQAAVSPAAAPAALAGGWAFLPRSDSSLGGATSFMP